MLYIQHKHNLEMKNNIHLIKLWPARAKALCCDTRGWQKKSPGGRTSSNLLIYTHGGGGFEEGAD